MRVFLALIVGVALGIAAVWYFNKDKGRNQFQTAGDQIRSTAQSAGTALEDKFSSLKLNTSDISNELARTGRVIRQKTGEAGQAIADATADARTTAAIKAKLVREPGLSAWDISVNTTGGVVTLSGTVPGTESIGKAMAVALEADGARQVISTLQIKPKQ